jgi:transposase-like protein
MDLEVDHLTGAGNTQNDVQRLAQRNGYRDHDWETRAGAVELRIPLLWKGKYSPAETTDLSRVADQIWDTTVSATFDSGLCG